MGADTPVWSKVVGGVRFDGPLESEFLVDFAAIGRRSRHEMWAVLLIVITTGVIFHHALLRVPPEVLPLGRTLLIAVVVPMILRWLSGDRSPLQHFSSVLYILSVYIDVGCLIALRIACIRHGLDVVPLVMPVAILMSIIVVQIRFLLLAPAIVAGLAGVVGAELWAFETTSNRLFDIAASVALVTVALGAAYELERWTRIGWLRQRRLDELTRIDALTGVPNRRYFDSRVAELVHSTAGSRQHVAMLLIDIDDFKSFNDHYGHLAGDDCLRRVGDYLNRSMDGPGQFCARLGGEEFAAIWVTTRPEQIAARAEELRAGIARMAIPGAPGRGPVVTASAGLVIASPTEPSAVGDLLRRADGALYRAKHDGRDRLCVATGTATQSTTGTRSARGQEPAAVPIGARSTLLNPAYLAEPDETEFRADFDRQGRVTRAAIMLGLNAVCVFLIFAQHRVMQIPPEASRLGTLTLEFGLMPLATLSAVASLAPRFHRWSAPMFVVAVAGITTAQMVERVLQLSRGYDVVPYLMPTSVLLSLCVVRLRFGVLAVAMLTLLTWVSAIELWAFPWTSNRLLTVGTSALMAAVTVRFAYKLERSTRMAWLNERKLDRLTRTDPLTCLPNRRSFDEALDAITAHPDSARRVAVMVLDLDDFKGFNDRHGHPAGDDVLHAVGMYLQRATAGQQVSIARIGGEEFAALWIDGEDARAQAHRLRDGITDLPRVAETAEAITASAGYAEDWLPADTDAASFTRSLLKRADDALYSAKAQGRDLLVEPTDTGAPAAVRYE